MNIKPEVYKKLNIVTFICTIFVIFIHSDNTSQYMLAGKAGESVWFAERIVFMSIIDNAVPIFFLISGFLFFMNYSSDTKIEKLKKRFVSIVIPYLLWNTLYTFISIVFGITPLGDIISDTWVMNPVCIKNILKGVFLYSYLPVFWYMAYLILFITLSPLLYYIIRNKYIGVAFCICYLLTCQLEIPYVNVYFLLYAIGGYVALNFACILDKESTGVSICISIIVYSIVVAFRVFLKNSSMDDLAIIKVLIVFIMFACLFMISNAFLGYSDSLFVKRQFYIYCTHLFILSVYKKVFRMIAPDSPFFAILFYILVPIIVLFTINCIAYINEKKFPKLYKIMTGGRVTKISEQG